MTDDTKDHGGEPTVERNEKGQLQEGSVCNPAGGQRGKNSRRGKALSDRANKNALGKLLKKSHDHMNSVLRNGSDDRKDKMVGLVLAEFGKAEERQMKKDKLLLEMRKQKQEMALREKEANDAAKENGDSEDSGSVISFNRAK